MARNKNNKSADPGVRPVIKAELSDKNRTLRWILIVGFVLIAVVSFYFGISAVLEPETGWAQVDCASTEVNCSSDFILSYDFGRDGNNPTKEEKYLIATYSDLTESAYQIFYNGLESVNKNLNQPVTVDPALYKALALVQQYGNRSLYLAPVYLEYDRIFLSSSDVDAASYDPGQDSLVAEYVGQIAEFANNPAMIDLQLLENNQVRLFVSDAYLTFAQENEISVFAEFGWLRNAFIIDYIADALVASGFTNGFISSYDGFTRNLDQSGEAFSLNLFDRQDYDIFLAGTMQYTKPISIVFLRDYPMGERDVYHYYSFANGRIVSIYIDALDGMCKSAVDSLTSYSYQTGCAEILLQQIPVFISNTWNAVELENMTQSGVYSIWFEGDSLYCNDSDMSIKLNSESGIVYKVIYTD